MTIKINDEKYKENLSTFTNSLYDQYADNNFEYNYT